MKANAEDEWYPKLNTGSGHGSTDKPIRSKPVGFAPPPPKVEMPQKRRTRPR